MHTLHEVSIDNKRVVLRVDFNVPMVDGTVGDDARIKATLPTIEYCLARNAEVVLLSHLGRPRGRDQPDFSLLPVARRLEGLLGRRVEFITNWNSYFQSVKDSKEIVPGKTVLLENLRFDSREEANSAEFGAHLGTIGDIYVFEAFATAHRAHASTCAAIKAAPISCSGFLVAREIQTLTNVMKTPTRPLVAVVGGAKVSGKLEVLDQLGKLADSLLVGGGIANTLLLAKGHSVGQSLVELELQSTAQRFVTNAALELPVDVMVGHEVSSKTNSIFRLLDQISDIDVIADIGPETARRYAKIIENAGTILWNGPMGVFEIDQFGEGTRVVTNAVGNSIGYSVAGGGDTIAAISKYGAHQKFNYISTGGGAFLKFIEGRKLPALQALGKD